MENTINYIREIIADFNPETALVLGSGLGDFAEEFESIKIPYAQIPEWGVSKVEGHKGMLVFAQVRGKKVVMMQGRFHYYEGYSMPSVVLPVKVFKKLGVKNLILTNAAGAINPYFTPGDFMLIKDHINFMGLDPLMGMNDNELGVRFPDMSEIYKTKLIKISCQAAKGTGVRLKKGVYCAKTGPSYETPAEIKMLRKFGADAVGMSTVPEAIVANYCGIDVLGISCITNYAAGVTNSKLSHSEVIAAANLVKNDFQALLLNLIALLP